MIHILHLPWVVQIQPHLLSLPSLQHLSQHSSPNARLLSSTKHHILVSPTWEQNRRKACQMRMHPSTDYNMQKHIEHTILHLSLIHISEPTRLGMISYAVF